MQPKFTRINLGSLCRKVFMLALILLSVSRHSYSQTVLFNEGFAAVPPAGWAQQNLSNPIGTAPTWFQGNATVFPSHGGGATEYIAVNYQSVAASGTTISNWLFTPQVLLTNGDVLTFWTRTTDAGATIFPDRLQVRLSTNGGSTNVGTTDVSVGDFTTLLQDINPTYDPNGFPHTWTLYTITISGLSSPVQGRIAFRYFVENGGPNGANSDYMGLDDVQYYQTVTPACSGAPVLGSTIASASAVCPGTPVDLSTQNVASGSGITLQWQSGPTASGPWTNISGATSATYSTTLTASTYFQLVASCNGTPGNSDPILVNLNPPSQCYCVPTDDCSFDDVITNVQFGGIDNTSDCAATGYTDFTTSVAAGTAYSGTANPISVHVGPGGNEVVTVWIDYDHSGTFDNNEYSLIGNGNNVTINGSITIPSSALTGLTRMRVRVRYNAAVPAGNACNDLVFGETEDYAVNITPCIPGVVTSNPSSTNVTCGQPATFSAAATGTFVAYQWQEKGASGLWTNLTDGGTVSGATTGTLTLNPVDASMNGYQYRLLISGGCTSPDFSQIATLTVDPLVINVDPASYSTCSPIPSNSPIALTITTQNGVSTSTTQTFNSGAVNTIIPDGDDAGITSSVPVALPANAIITAASVKLNITHTWAGDLVIALKAPNGNVLNLDYGLTQTGGASATTGFTNTVISSAGTATLVSGSDPWTGIFAPDAPTNPGTVPTAATSLSPTNANVFTFPDLYSVPSGNWTLGVFDYAAPDEGTFLNWELSLTYSSSVTVPFTGVWSPSAGLFLDAAGNTPYDGSEQTTVYAAPTSTTTYTVTVTDAACVPAPVEVPVSILSPDPSISISAAPYAQVYPGLQTVLTSTITPAASSSATFQWFLNGTPIEGATSQNLQIGVDGIGDLSVVMTDPTICSGSVSASYTLRDSLTSTLFIYPNPNAGLFQVRFDDGVNDILAKPRVMTIYDSKGARVYTKTYNVTVPYQRMDVDFSQLPKGIYVIELTGTNGRRLATGRVVVR